MMTFLKTIDFDEGWQFLETRIMKLRRILEGHPEPQFDPEEYMMMYTIVFNMCNQKHLDHSRRLYDKYKEIVQENISSMVPPSLREKHGEFMLQELVKCWMNHKVMVTWLYRFFHYLDRYFVYTWYLPSINEVALTCFHDMVYEELKGKAKDVVIAAINREQEGEMIDRALLKNVVDIYVEIGMGQMNYYVNDFENDMLAATAAYYSRKASKWIMKDSCPDYMLMAEYCLRKEKERVSHYLHSSSEPKLLENVQNELLIIYSSQVLEKEYSGWAPCL